MLFIVRRGRNLLPSRIGPIDVLSRNGSKQISNVVIGQFDFKRCVVFSKLCTLRKIPFTIIYVIVVFYC